MSNRKKYDKMIKKALLASLFLTMIGTAVRAQTSRGPLIRLEWGITGGVNFSRYAGSGVSVSDKTGYQLGISMGVGFGRIALRPEIIYVRQRIDIVPDGGTALALKSNSLEVPVLVTVRLLRPLKVYGGPVFTALSSCKYTDIDGYKVNFGSIRPTVSYALGANLTILRHLLVDVRYNGHFSSSSNVLASDGREVRLRANSFTVGVGYVF